MEILSIGEKIKRARIYKGFTLKDLSSGKVSVSKMSCIENNKVPLEDEILEFISAKLELDIDYLKEDIEEQINRNIQNLNHQSEMSEFEKEINYNLEVAEEYGYYNSAFNILHLLINYYLQKEEKKKIQAIITEYYDLCQKSHNELNRTVYYLDLGKYLFINCEYKQAINYFNNVSAFMEDEGKEDEMLAEAVYYEAKCLIKMKSYNTTFRLYEKLQKLVSVVNDSKLLAEIYELISLLALKMKKSEFDELFNKCRTLYKINAKKLIFPNLDYAESYFEIGDRIKAVSFIKSGLQEFPKENRLKYTNFLLQNVKLLISYSEYELADSLLGDALNSAIALNEDELIEKAYYYRSQLLYKQENYLMAEMYINLSLDVLTKYGNKKDVYARYMEIGNLYYAIGAISDALKYFSLAVSLEKKI